MTHDLVTFFVLKINVVVDNYCLLTKRLTLELPLRKLADWPRSLQEFTGVYRSWVLYLCLLGDFGHQPISLMITMTYSKP